MSSSWHINIWKLIDGFEGVVIMTIRERLALPLWSALFVGVLVVSAICIAAWQWNLAIDKEKVIIKWNDRQQKSVTLEKALRTLAAPYSETKDPETLEYLLTTPIALEGALIPDLSWLLDQNLNNERMGYDVLVAFSPVSPDNNVIVLVNTGWVASGYAFKGQQPEISKLQHNLLQWKVKIIHIALNNSSMPSFSTDDPNIGHYLRIQDAQTAIKALSSRAQQVYYAILLPETVETSDKVFVQQERYTSAGFVYHFDPLLEGPEKHRAYAIQWLLLAFVLLMIFKFALLQNKEVTASKREFHSNSTERLD